MRKKTSHDDHALAKLIGGILGVTISLVLFWLLLSYGWAAMMSHL